MASPPASSVRVVGSSETGNGFAVQPGLYAAIGAQVVFKAFPGACRKRLGSRSTLRGEVGKSGIVRLAVVHQNLVLATDTKVLIRTLGGVGHSNEGDVAGGKGGSGFTGRG